MPKPETPIAQTGIVVIQTERTGTTLRQFIPEDASPLFALIDQNRDHLSKHGDDTAIKYPTYESVEQSITNPKNPNKLRLGVGDGKILVGTVNLTPKDEEAEIGYWIGKQFAGNRYAAIAAKVLAKYAKEAGLYKKIFAKVKKENEPSIRSLVKAGFRRTGEDAEDYIYVYGVEE